jgi:hypothetical protein
MSLLRAETEKYEAAWSYPAYAEYSPGLEAVDLFERMVEENSTSRGLLKEIAYGDPPKRGSLIDLGCGSGKAGIELSERGFDVTLMDLTPKGKVGTGLSMIVGSLWHPIPGKYRFGYCCDVMEHIPPEYTMLVISNILRACEYAFFQICLVDDNFGALVGEPLHLTVMPFVWWRDQIKELGDLVESRDLIQNGAYLVRSTIFEPTG